MILHVKCELIAQFETTFTLISLVKLCQPGSNIESKLPLFYFQTDLLKFLVLYNPQFCIISNSKNWKKFTSVVGSEYDE